MKFKAKIRTLATKHDASGDLFTDVTFRFYQEKINGDPIPRSATVAMKLTGAQCLMRDEMVEVDIPSIEEG